MNDTRDNSTRLERLEKPAPELTPPSPPAPQPSAAAQATYDEVNARVDKIRTGGAV